MNEITFFFSYGIPGIPVIPWCCSIRLLRFLCCSSRCIAAFSWEFSTYKSLTSRSALVSLCDCSAIKLFWTSIRWQNSVISLRCWCHDSAKIKDLWTFFCWRPDVRSLKRNLMKNTKLPLTIHDCFRVLLLLFQTLLQVAIFHFQLLDSLHQTRMRRTL